MQLRAAQTACVRPANKVAVPTRVSPTTFVRPSVSMAASQVEQIGQEIKDKGKENTQPQQPGNLDTMKTKPLSIKDDYKGSDKLKGKVALITGGDSGIGRAVAIHFAREGAKGIVIVHTEHEHKDGAEAVKLIEKEGAKAINIVADVGDAAQCKKAVDAVIKEFGQLDILINNAGEQTKQESILDISDEQLQRTFATNVFGMFYLVKAALPHMKKGSSIVNTASLLAYISKPMLVDYASSKGAVVSFTRSLSEQLLQKGIRVNAVAPGPTWSPLIPSAMGPEAAEGFGEGEVPMARGGQPAELAPAYVFLASEITGSFINGQVIHPNGGAVLNV